MVTSKKIYVGVFESQESSLFAMDGEDLKTLSFDASVIYEIIALRDLAELLNPGADEIFHCSKWKKELEGIISGLESIDQVLFCLGVFVSKGIESGEGVYSKFSSDCFEFGKLPHYAFPARLNDCVELGHMCGYASDFWKHRGETGYHIVQFKVGNWR